MSNQDEFFNDNDVEIEREAALKDLNKANKSVLNNGKKKSGTFLIVIIGIAALVFVFMLKSGGNTTKEKAEDEFTIAPKKTMEKIEFKIDEIPTNEENIKSTENTVVERSPELDKLELEKQRLEMIRKEQERKMFEARMKSSIVMPGSQNIDPSLPKEDSLNDIIGNINATSRANEKGAKDSNSQFTKVITGTSVPSVKAKLIEDLDTKILQGTLIEAVLLPMTTSDLPGGISCQVSRDVYSEDGKKILIPWGSKIFGQYNAGVRKGQNRLFVVWNRLVTPSGISINLDSPGADQLGMAGMGGTVDNHFWEMFGAAVLLSLIGGGATHIGDTSSDGSDAYYKKEIYDAFSQSAETILSTYVNIPPTINVAPGTRVRIFVSQDLDFSTVVEQKAPGQLEQIKVIF